MAHVPNVFVFEDFENFVMLLNFSELVSVVTPSRYNEADGFDNTAFKIARQHGRELRKWLNEHFILSLVPPSKNRQQDTDVLGTLLVNSLAQQVHKLLHNIQRWDSLGVSSSTYVDEKDVEREITAVQVQRAILNDLSDVPSFKELWSTENRKEPPSSYCLPLPPAGTRYIVTRRV
ncbi:hypothetical protein GYMLUDRAFT_250345 [Collybiopsis luxurians FD-317 M1]|uniref:Uncharacterized protein n=1 Tax=Collybiopsis luxurians FD-317 M1 TaxID=944289 RepID=A0A0D0CF23_9AGAR|nr:hypothetical protein GYMLUDRAFT_250345 [Collybiopsis luxurians FD-317 M1]